MSALTLAVSYGRVERDEWNNDTINVQAYREITQALLTTPGIDVNGKGQEGLTAFTAAVISVCKERGMLIEVCQEPNYPISNLLGK